MSPPALAGAVQHLEQRATLWPWAVADDALVGLGDALADGQTQPGAEACVASGADQPVRLRTEEPLEQLGHILRRHPAPLV